MQLEIIESVQRRLVRIVATLIEKVVVHFGMSVYHLVERHIVSKRSAASINDAFTSFVRHCAQVLSGRWRWLIYERRCRRAFLIIDASGCLLLGEFVPSVFVKFEWCLGTRMFAYPKTNSIKIGVACQWVVLACCGFVHITQCLVHHIQICARYRCRLTRKQAIHLTTHKIATASVDVVGFFGVCDRIGTTVVQCVCSK